MSRLDLQSDAVLSCLEVIFLMVRGTRVLRNTEKKPSTFLCYLYDTVILALWMEDHLLHSCAFIAIDRRISVHALEMYDPNPRPVHLQRFRHLIYMLDPLLPELKSELVYAPQASSR